MHEFMITFSLARDGDLDRQAREEDHFRRESAVYQAAFKLGTAWHGNQGAIVLRANLTSEEVAARLEPLFGGSDLLLVIDITSRGPSCYRGWITDREGFEELLPDVTGRYSLEG